MSVRQKASMSDIAKSITAGCSGVAVLMVRTGSSTVALVAPPSILQTVARRTHSTTKQLRLFYDR